MSHGSDRAATFYTLAYGFAAVVGIFLTFTIPGLEVSETGLAGGLVTMMGVLGLIVVWVSQTRINTANYYLGAANLQAFGERLRIKLPSVVWLIITAIIIYLMMLLPVVQYLLLALAWQGVLVTAWVAIALVHILMDKGRNQEHAAIADGNYKAFNTNGLVAWIAGTAVGLFFLQLGSFDPNLAGVGATWGPILTVVVSAVVYALLWKANPTSRTGLIEVIGQ